MTDAESYLLSLLERMADSCGTSFDRRYWRRALEQSIQKSPGDPLSVGSRWISQLEGSPTLRLQPALLTPDDARRFARPDAPIAIPSIDPARPVVLVFESVSSRVRIWAGKDESISVAAFHSLVGDAAVRAVLVESIEAFPFEETASPEDGEHASHASPLKRLLALARVESNDLWVVFVFALVVGLFTLAVPIAVEALVTTVMFGALLQPLFVLSTALFAFLSASAILRGAQLMVMEIVQRRIFVRVVDDLAFRLPRVEPRVLDDHYAPELVNRFLETSSVQKHFSAVYLDSITIVMQTVIGMIVLAFYHPWLIGFDFFLFVMLVTAIFIIGRGAVQTSIEESRMKFETTAWLQDVVRCRSSFRLSGAADFAFDRADYHAKQYLRWRTSHFRLLFRQVVFVLALEAIASTVLLGMGGWLVIHGQLTLGQLVASELIVTMIVASFAKLGKHFEAYYDLMASLEKLGHLLDMPVDRATGLKLPRLAGGASLEVRDITIDIEPHFGPVSLTLAAGEHLAVRGPCGSGKSLLLEMLYGLRTPSSGYVKVDGHDLRNVELDSLRESVALAAAIEIFGGTVEENITMGRSGVGHHDVEHCLALVGLAAPIQRLANGLNTRLTRGTGRPLSDGQLHQLMIARALVGSPRLLLIDGLLDSLSNEQLHQARSIFANKAMTIVVVTNRRQVAEWCSSEYRLEAPESSMVVVPETQHA